jgi:thymidine kinase
MTSKSKEGFRDRKPMMIGFRGPMFSEKTKNIVLLAKMMMIYGYKVVVLSPGVDVRTLEETRRTLERIEHIHSGCDIPMNVDGWYLSKNILDDRYRARLTMFDDVFDTQMNPQTCTVGYNFVKSRSQDRILALSVSEITTRFLDLLFSKKDTILRTSDNLPYIPDVIFVDECQFLERNELESVYDVVFLKYRKHLVLSGLISDYKQEPWGYYHLMEPYMSFSFLVKARCIDCGKKNAIHTRKFGSKTSFSKHEDVALRLSGSVEDVVQIGDGDIYYAICTACIWREIDRITARVVKK